jgi:hypothetical protein
MDVPGGGLHIPYFYNIRNNPSSLKLTAPPPPGGPLAAGLRIEMSVRGRPVDGRWAEELGAGRTRARGQARVVARIRSKLNHGS